MITDWIDHATRMALMKADYWSGCRKILRGRTLQFNDWDNDLQMEDAGYNSRAKMNQLRRGYYNEQSITAALDLWAERQRRGNYGSFGICTYNHYIKFSAKKDLTVEEFKKQRKGKVSGSIMGPCIQSILITQLKRGQVAIDLSYRTTEFFKKFPADLVFVRDAILPQFKLPEIVNTNIYFANITMHPMYFMAIAPGIISGGESLIKYLDQVKRKDRRFWEWIVKWNARYLVPKYGRGVEKFAQAQRVKDDIENRIPIKLRRELKEYLNDNHPGHSKVDASNDDGET